MSFGQFGILPFGLGGRGLWGALAIIQDIILVITAMTIVNVLWMCLGRRKVGRRAQAAHGQQPSSAVRMRPVERGHRESSRPAVVAPATRRTLPMPARWFESSPDALVGPAARGTLPMKPRRFESSPDAVVALAARTTVPVRARRFGLSPAAAAGPADRATVPIRAHGFESSRWRS